MTGRLRAVGVTLAVVAAVAAMLRGAPPPQGKSFGYVDPAFTQELFATTVVKGGPGPGPGGPGPGGKAFTLGGVAVLPSGDVFAAECVTTGTRLHRFSAPLTTPTARHGGAHRNHSADVARRLRHGLPPGRHALHEHERRRPRRRQYRSDDRPDPPSARHAGQCRRHRRRSGEQPHRLRRPELRRRVDHHLHAARPRHRERRGRQPHGLPGARTSRFVNGIYFEPTGAFLFLSNRWPNPTGHGRQQRRHPRAERRHGRLRSGRPRVQRDVAEVRGHQQHRRLDVALRFPRRRLHAGAGSRRNRACSAIAAT